MTAADDISISLRRVIRDPETGEETRDLFWELAGAESGDPEAMLQLAIAYLEGDGVEQSDQEAARWMTRAAELDEPNAQYSLGMFYGQGCGVERSFEKVRYWMGRAEKNGDMDAPEIVENIKGVEEIQAAADAGDPEAQAKIAGILMSFHSPQNFRESLEYAKKAAEGGSLHGMYVLALAYQHGRGTEQDHKAAFHWYEKAAVAGYAPAQTNLACLYGRGDGVEQDEETAMQWLRKAADQQDPDALRILSNAPKEPEEEAADDAAGAAVLEGLKAGDPQALKKYAMACLQGQAWAEHGPDHGLEILKELGAGGDDEAYALVALAYEFGMGVPWSLDESAKWYELAARNGDPELELALAKFYMHEIDGKMLDKEKCLHYAQSAADKGNFEARSLITFVICMEALKAKGILTGEEDSDEMMDKIHQAVLDGDEDAIAFFK